MKITLNTDVKSNDKHLIKSIGHEFIQVKIYSDFYKSFVVLGEITKLDLSNECAKITFKLNKNHHQFYTTPTSVSLEYSEEPLRWFFLLHP